MDPFADAEGVDQQEPPRLAIGVDHTKRRRSPIDEELEMLQRSMRSMRKRQFARDRQMALNKLSNGEQETRHIQGAQLEGKGFNLRYMKDPPFVPTHTGLAGQAIVSQSYSTVRLVRRPGSEVNKVLFRVGEKLLRRTQTGGDNQAIPGEGTNPNIVKGERVTRSQLSIAVTHSASERESDDEWTKEESAIFEILDNLEESLTTSTRGNTTMSEPYPRPLSEVYEKGLCGRIVHGGTNEDEMAEVAIHFETNGHNILAEGDTATGVGGRRRHGVAGLIRRRGAQANLRAAMEVNMSSDRSGQDCWWKVAEEMTAGQEESDTLKARTKFGFKKGLRTLEYTWDRSEGKENLKSTPYWRSQKVSSLSIFPFASSKATLGACPVCPIPRY